MRLIMVPSNLLCLCVLILALPVFAEPVNMLSLQEGTLPVIVPPNYGGWVAHSLLDDSPGSGWACENGLIADNVFVFELVAPVAMTAFVFDNANVDAEGAGAKDVLVEVSDTSAVAGFQPVLAAALADRQDGQEFPATGSVTGRWVRLTIRTNQGNGEWTELFSFRGLAEKPELPTPDNISGTYATDYAEFHLLQQGTALSGCYEYDEGLLEGSIEGRVMKLTWRESGGPDDTGPAVMVFAPDGQSFRGFWWKKGSEKGEPEGTWDGKLIAGEIGSCPHWSGSVGGELKKQLAAQKRARIYGILFDTNSARIKAESQPVLDQVVAMLQEETRWSLTIEGHTDAVGSEEANLVLSRQRAAAVKDYLVSAGVDAGRLQAAGFGENAPVADNDTELGRAQNRRVELVRE